MGQKRSERRRLLTEALWRIAAERGLDEVGIREVAATAGVSIGTVQYYFRTKDELLLFAFRHLTDAILARVVALDRDGPIRQSLRAALLELLPLDERRTVEGRVYLAFAARAAVVPALAKVQAEALGELRAHCADALALAAARGELATAIEPEREAVLLAALVDGLLLHALSDPRGVPPNTVADALDAALDRLFRAGAPNAGQAADGAR